MEIELRAVTARHGKREAELKKDDLSVYVNLMHKFNRIFFLFEDLNIDENRDEDDLSPEEFTKHIKEEYDRIVTK
jgi:hypothetical protein